MICNQDFPKEECPQINCRKDDCCGCPFRKVVIPAIAGDDGTGTVIPENGLFVNALVEYEANGAMYIYSSDGIYTRIGSNSKSEEAASVAYVDTQISSTKRYADQGDVATLQLATSQAQVREAQILTDAKDYTDGKATATLNAAQTYIDNKTAPILQDAKDYADTKDAAVLQAAKDYTDSAASSVVTRTYVDNGDTTALNTAKAYTDQEVDAIENSLATVATSGSYDDLNNKPAVPTIVTTNIDPGEGADLAANTYIFVYDAGA